MFSVQVLDVSSKKRPADVCCICRPTLEELSGAVLRKSKAKQLHAGNRFKIVELTVQDSRYESKSGYTNFTYHVECFEN